MPQVEIDVDESLVRRLLGSLPDPLAHLRGAPVERVATGWDNSVWRLGSDASAEYAVRIPVRAAAAPMIETATAWVAAASEPLREHGITVPVPIHCGPPTAGLPWSWSLVTWVPGTLLSEHPVAHRAPAALALAQSLPHFHRPASPAAPVSASRGVPLASRRHLITRSEPGAREVLGNRVVGDLLAIIAAAEAAPAWPHAPTWCHGDLHDRNLTLHRRTTRQGPGCATGAAHPADTGGRRAGATVGVLDFDDLTRGDPAVDLRVLWIAFDEPTRAQAMARLEASGAYDPAIWIRARGWAAASFVLPVAADAEGRELFAAAIAHTCRELSGR